MNINMGKTIDETARRTSENIRANQLEDTNEKEMTSCYWAIFEQIEQHIFRFDTRVYLTKVAFPLNDDVCIGAVVGKNPGSAKASYLGRSGLQPIQLNRDKCLPTVRNILWKACVYRGGIFPPRVYIQFLNLFYLCNPSLSKAIKTYTSLDCSLNVGYCATEKKKFPWVWYIWGGRNDQLSVYKLRFKHIHTNHAFFYDKHHEVVRDTFPSIHDFAKHTQGLKHNDVVPYIAAILGAYGKT